MLKRANGVFYTEGNPFANRAFKKWSKKAQLPDTEILEPFAGKNSLIETLRGMNLCRHAKSFDIAPGARGVLKRDTLASFPKGYDVCITNPPWLAKNSATARKLPFPETEFDDLYKHALDKCLYNCGYVAALVPESFIRANLFQTRLTDFISLTGKMFLETGHPVGLALFTPDSSSDVTIWHNTKSIGKLSALKKHYPKPHVNPIAMRFNDPHGNLGLIAIDDTSGPTIRFCAPSELKNYQIKESCRAMTKISVEAPISIKNCNERLGEFRQKTEDVFLTCFKGMRKDGRYRRRLDWATARGIINHAHQNANYPN